MGISAIGVISAACAVYAIYTCKEGLPVRWWRWSYLVIFLVYLVFNVRKGVGLVLITYMISRVQGRDCADHLGTIATM